MLTQRLGEGGMATVFVGERDDGVAVERVAVKVVHEHLLRSSMGADLRRRFQREVAAMRSLDHENIVACVDAGQVGDAEYLTSEFVSGGSVADALGRHGKFPLGVALAFFVELLDGLHHAHAKGIVHRDLKPDNLLIAEDGILKIADFGIARLAEGTALTASGTFVGTPAYMSPEQAQALAIDNRSDLYSAGVILYELLAGRNPFADAQVMVTLSNVLQGNFRPLAEVEVCVPVLVDHVVGRLMSIRPDDRFSTADEVMLALAPLCARHGVPLPPRLTSSGARITSSASTVSLVPLLRRARQHMAARDPSALTEVRRATADAFVDAARQEHKKGAGRRLAAGYLAFKASSIDSDHQEARNLMRTLGHGTLLRFGRSTALYTKEVDADRAHDVRTAWHAVARDYMADGNPSFAALSVRKAMKRQGIDDSDLALLADVLPDDDIDDLRALLTRQARAQPSLLGGQAQAPLSPSLPSPSPSPSTAATPWPFIIIVAVFVAVVLVVAAVTWENLIDMQVP
jgi:tRNA A-37 threonylcarbamoyl transferase component Bud32